MTMTMRQCCEAILQCVNEKSLNYASSLCAPRLDMRRAGSTRASLVYPEQYDTLARANGQGRAAIPENHSTRKITLCTSILQSTPTLSAAKQTILGLSARAFPCQNGPPSRGWDGNGRREPPGYQRAVMRRAKAALGLSGMRGRTLSIGDGYEFRPDGMATAPDVTYSEA